MDSDVDRIVATQLLECAFTISAMWTRIIPRIDMFVPTSNSVSALAGCNFYFKILATSKHNIGSVSIRTKRWRRRFVSKSRSAFDGMDNDNNIKPTTAGA